MKGKRFRTVISSFLFQSILVLFVGVFVRYLFVTYTYFTPVAADSVSYLWAARDIAEANPPIKGIVNTIRPPVYPLFLSFFFRAHPYTNDQLISTYLINVIQPSVFLIQSGTALLSCVLLLWLLRQLVGKKLAFILTVLYATNLILITWERYLLTESFSMSLVILAVSLLYLYLKRYQLRYLVLFTATVLLFTFLRSTGIAFILTAFFGLLMLGKKRVLVPVVGSLLMCLFFIVWYMLLNKFYYGYATFQFSSSVNIFGRTLTHGYSIPNLPNNPVAAEVQRFSEEGKPLLPFDILPQVNGAFYNHPPTMKALDAYNKTSLRSIWPQYLKDSVNDYFSIWKDVSGWILLPPFNPSWEKLTSPRVIAYFSQLPYVSMYNALVILFYFFPLFSLFLFYRRYKYSLFYGFLAVLVFSQFASAVLFGFEEFGRLVSSTTPLLFILFALVLDGGGKELIKIVKIPHKTQKDPDGTHD